MTTASIIWLSIFCACFGLALYTFLGYPLLMLFVSKIMRPRKRPDTSGQQKQAELRVAVVVAAYNERENIVATLKSFITQDYPHHRFEVVVFSDGSTDGTDDVVHSFASNRSNGGPVIRLVRYEGRLGKTECQNRTVEQLLTHGRPDVVVFSDGNILWQKDALRLLVEPFADQRVGATTGALHLVRRNGSAMTLEKTNEGLFRRFDHAIKKGESRLLSAVGVNGPIYAVRTDQYVRLQQHLVSDLVLPLLIAARGKRVEYVPEAIGLESATDSIWHEFRRKRRLVTQGFVALPLLLRAAHPWRRPGLNFLLISHKVLRWVGIELLGISLVATVVLVILASPVQPVFVGVLLLEIASLLLATLGILFSEKDGDEPNGTATGPAILEALSFFVLTNIASLVAVVDYVRGETATRWRTER